MAFQAGFRRAPRSDCRPRPPYGKSGVLILASSQSCACRSWGVKARRVMPPSGLRPILPNSWISHHNLSWLISILTPPLLRSMGRTGISLKIQFLVFHDFVIQCYNITITHIVIFVNTVFLDSRKGSGTILFKFVVCGGEKAAQIWYTLSQR